MKKFYHLSSGKFTMKNNEITSCLLKWLSKRQKITSIGRNVKKGKPLGTVGRNVNWYSHYGNCMKIPQNNKNRTIICYCSSISQGNESSFKEIFHVQWNIIHNSQNMESTQVFMNRWMDKEMWYICTIDIFTLKKKQEILSFMTTWMNLEDLMLNEISQAQKDKYCMILLISGMLKVEVSDAEW